VTQLDAFLWQNGMMIDLNTVILGPVFCPQKLFELNCRPQLFVTNQFSWTDQRIQEHEVD
jgi:hypothetical protein